MAAGGERQEGRQDEACEGAHALPNPVWKLVRAAGFRGAGSRQAPESTAKVTPFLTFGQPRAHALLRAAPRARAPCHSRKRPPRSYPTRRYKNIQHSEP